MVWNPDNYSAGLTAGRQEASRSSLGVGLFERLQNKEREASMQDDILTLKRRLAGMTAVKEALKNALRDVAPNHPLVNPMDNNPELYGIGRAAENRITSAEDKV